jgi:hypothetical protein
MASPEVNNTQGKLELRMCSNQPSALRRSVHGGIVETAIIAIEPTDAICAVR